MNTTLSGALVLCTVVAAGSVAAPGVASSATSPVPGRSAATASADRAVRWDWSMPANVTSDRPDGIAVDQPLQPVPGYPEARNVAWGTVPADDRHPVDLTACATPVRGAASYRWSAPGAGYTSRWTSDCTTRARLPEGTHRVTVSVRDDGGVRHARGRVVVRNILMLVMGDSYSAGVGYPTLDGGKSPWLDKSGSLYELDDLGCSRTRWGGFVRAAVELERLDPRSNVTLIDVACGGAEISGTGGGMLTPQKAVQYLPAQIDQVNAIVGQRTIDVINLSIGGNDTGFGTVVETCSMLYLHDPKAKECWNAVVDGSGGRTLNEVVQANLEALPARYAELARCFGGTDCRTVKVVGGQPAAAPTPSRSLRVEPSDVVHVMYPNLIGASDGGLCRTPSFATPFSLVDSQWGDRGAIGFRTSTGSRSIDVGGRSVAWRPDGLRTQIRLNASRYGWSVRDGVFQGSRTHGICADDPAVYPMTAAINAFPQYAGKVPWWPFGVVHPTTLGQELYRKDLTAINPVVTGLPVAGPAAAPSAVRGLRVRAGLHRVHLAWRAPASDGGAAVTDYLWRRSRAHGGWSGWIRTTKLSAQLPRQADGTRLQVVARNRVGSGPVRQIGL